MGFDYKSGIALELSGYTNAIGPSVFFSAERSELIKFELSRLFGINIAT